MGVLGEGEGGGGSGGVVVGKERRTCEIGGHRSARSFRLQRTKFRPTKPPTGVLPSFDWQPHDHVSFSKACGIS